MEPKKRKVLAWTFERDELLIELVRTKSDLYDSSSPRYNDNLEKRRLWDDIGRQLGREGCDCKERWECLRSQYRKQVNKMKTKSGQTAANIPKWKYEDQMSFLCAHRRAKTRVACVVEKTESEEDEEEDFHDDREDIHSREETQKDEDEVPGHKSPPPGQARRRAMRRAAAGCSRCGEATLMNYLLEKKEQECRPDPIDVFFSLMATSVKKFSAADQHFVKTRVFSLVSEIEGKYLQNLHNYVPAAHSICLTTLPSPAQCSDASSA